MSREFQDWLPYTQPVRTLKEVERRVRKTKQLWEQGVMLKATLLSICGIVYDMQAHWKRVIVERKGKRRICFEPSLGLKKRQYECQSILTQRFITKGYRRVFPPFAGRDGVIVSGPFAYATAFASGDNVVKNAARHLANHSSYCVDLRNAYESVRTKHLYRYLLHQCFTNDEAWVLSQLLTFRSKLRQGAVSSPFIFNLMTERLDLELAYRVGAPLRREVLSKDGDQLVPVCDTTAYQMASRAGIIYTRYGDNLCFSSPLPVFPSQVKETIYIVLQQLGAVLNPKKTVECRNGVMEFPGAVVVQGRIQPLRKYIAGLFHDLQRGEVGNEAMQGHRGFCIQFPQEGAGRVLRAINPVHLDLEPNPESSRNRHREGGWW